MYRLGIEMILGVQRKGSFLEINPCIPQDWSGFELTYRVGATQYRIHVDNPERINRGIKQITLDGKDLPDGKIALIDDQEQHEVHVLMGRTHTV